MINLAGSHRFNANQQVITELQEAKVKTFTINLDYLQEVNSDIVGAFITKQCFFGFQRAWRYWVVKATKPFPLKNILEFNAHWGQDARIWGFAGGQSNQEVEQNHLNGDFLCLNSWHIDTQFALNAFVTFAKDVYGFELDYSLDMTALLINGNNLISGKIA